MFTDSGTESKFTTEISLDAGHRWMQWLTDVTKTVKETARMLRYRPTPATED